MMAEQSEDLARGVRRFIADLRALPDRRLWRERRRDQRTTTHAPTEAERRNDADRRVQPTDRRQRDNGTFLRVHVEIIREMIMDLGVDASCPQCDGNLLLGPIRSHEGGTARQVHCTTCRGSVVMVTVPGQPVEFA